MTHALIAMLVITMLSLPGWAALRLLDRSEVEDGDEVDGREWADKTAEAYRVLIDAGADPAIAIGVEPAATRKDGGEPLRLICPDGTTKPNPRERKPLVLIRHNEDGTEERLEAY